MIDRLTCACTATTGTATPASKTAGSCHCETCRKWSGGAFIGVACKDVTFDETATVGVWTSSAHGERLFCSTCGSTLVWQMQDGSHHSVNIHLFDDPARFPLGSEIFTDDKPDGYDFAGTHERLTRAEVMAKYAPKPEAH